MKRKIFIPFVVIAVLSVMFGFVSSAAGGGGGSVTLPRNFGFIFGIKGKVDLRAPRENPVRLNPEKDLLRVIKEGDKLRTNEDGKLVIVSLSKKMGYELMPDTLVRITAGSMSVIRGNVNKIEGLYFPDNIPSMPEKAGVMVADFPLSDSCIRPLSPLGTSIITTTPTFTWENECFGDKKVTVQLIANKRVVYQGLTGDTYMKVPKDVLDYEQECTWLVNGGRNGLVGGVFSIISEVGIKEVLEKKYHKTQHKDDLYERISYIFYLKNRGLIEMANAEIKSLKEEFPANPYIKIK
jgi:hypothetical protein